MKSFTFLKTITLINLLIATGFSIAGILHPLSILPINISTDNAITIFALYAGARTIPLALIVILSFVHNKWPIIIYLALLAGTIQLLDGFIGIYQHDLSKSIGPFVITIIEFGAIYYSRGA